MVDTHVSIGSNGRPEVNLRSSAQAPSVISRPIPITTPGTQVAPANDTDQLLRALDIQGARLGEAAAKAAKEGQEDALKEGEKARTINQLDYADAVAQGKIPTTANPWFIKGYHNQDGRVAGLDYYTSMRKAYGESEAKGSDDPQVFTKFQQDFTSKYMADKGKDKSTEWWDGFKVTSESARNQLTSEHAQQAEQAVVAKQEANTGAEINVILNSTKNPVEAGRLLNEMKARMKLAGMPEASFDKVTAEAVLAKAKLGDPGMLEVLKHVKTGGPTTPGTVNMEAADKTLGGLTPQEKTLYQTHLTNLGGKGGVNNPDGTRSTLFATTVEIDGKTYILPTVYGGQKITPAEAIKKAQAAGLQNFPSYASQADADKRYGQLHEFMEKDTKNFLQGSSATLASNPKVASALVDTQNAIKEQQRADTRWSWAQTDRAFSLESQAHAREGWAREKERNAREDMNWDRQTRARSLTTTILLGTMANPSDYRNATKDDLSRLATLDPDSMEKIVSFQERFTTRQEQVPEVNERPVRAQLQQEMLKAAGNPLLQQQLQLQAVALGGQGKLNKETVYRLIDDSTRFWSLDPSAQKKLQDPQVTAVLRTAREGYMEKGAMSLYGSAALDALATEQVINKAVLDHLLAKPTADGYELGQVASKALASVLPTTSPNAMGTGKVNALGGQAAKANERVSSGPDNPPQPAMKPELAVGSISAADKMEFLRQANEAHQKGASAFLAFIAEFDQKSGIPGLGQAIITQSATPPAAPRKNKGR